MIRTVPIPLSGGRLRQATESITYAGSTCTSRDASGLCIADVFLGDPSNPDNSGGGGMPGDPGEEQAVMQWAQQTGNDISTAGLNQLVLAESLNAGNIPSPLPGLGLTIPNPVKDALKKLLLIGGAVVLGIAILDSGGRRR